MLKIMTPQDDEVTSSWRVVPSWFIYKCDESYTLCLNVIFVVTPVMEMKPCSSTWRSEAATRGVLWKNVFLEISQNLQESTCARVSFLIKLQVLQAKACNFVKKETLVQVFSCEFCKISNNTFFTEHLWTTASGSYSASLPRALPIYYIKHHDKLEFLHER